MHTHTHWSAHTHSHVQTHTHTQMHTLYLLEARWRQLEVLGVRDRVQVYHVVCSPVQNTASHTNAASPQVVFMEAPLMKGLLQKFNKHFVPESGVIIGMDLLIWKCEEKRLQGLWSSKMGVGPLIRGLFTGRMERRLVRMCTYTHMHLILPVTHPFLFLPASIPFYFYQ